MRLSGGFRGPSVALTQDGRGTEELQSGNEAPNGGDDGECSHEEIESLLCFPPEALQIRFIRVFQPVLLPLLFYEAGKELLQPPRMGVRERLGAVCHGLLHRLVDGEDPATEDITADAVGCKERHGLGGTLDIWDADGPMGRHGGGEKKHNGRSQSRASGHGS